MRKGPKSKIKKKKFKGPHGQQARLSVERNSLVEYFKRWCKYPRVDGSLYVESFCCCGLSFLRFANGTAMSMQAEEQCLLSFSMVLTSLSSVGLALHHLSRSEDVPHRQTASMSFYHAILITSVILRQQFRIETPRPKRSSVLVR